MLKNKLLLLILLGSAFIFLASTSYSPVPLSTPASQLVYQQNPPIVEHIRVRKIAPLPSGGDNIVMEIEYEDSTVIDDSIVIDQGAVGDIVFRDNGVAPDVTANDWVYTASFVENIPLFRSTIANWQTALANKVATQGRYIRFEGHNGYEVSTAPTFNFGAFDLFDQVDLSTDVVNVGGEAYECSSIEREKSLFITDLSVVQDPLYTYNSKANAGNPLGAWSFGRMIKSMSGTNNVNTFLKEWIKHWLVTQTINGQAVATRKQIVQQLIEPWIRRAYANNFQPLAINTITELNWESYWLPSAGHFMNNEMELFKSAPFRLTTIVNRIDLRGNTGYTNSISNAGETRFIFTLINPNDHIEMFPDFPLGDIPIHKDPTPSELGPWPMVDWVGMNVIFEYGNVQTNKCDLRAFAKQWIDLSYHAFPADPTLPNPAYNSALAAITNTVTYPNVGIESAINNIRTNEKLFFETDFTLSFFPRWDEATWEMRQFQLSNSNMIAEVPVTNTPVDETNIINQDFITASNSCPSITDASDWCADGNHAEALGGWVTASPANKLLVLKGRHNIPLSYLSYPLLAGSSIAKAEYAHSQRLAFPDGNDYDPERRKLRQRLSVNTCQGCHGGETKTIFTQVRPLSYGVPARYWLANPDFTAGELDGEFNIENVGLTSSGVMNYPIITGLNRWANVSAFLTGRNYSGSIPGPGVFTDDDPSDVGDASMEGLYYVNDPLNSYDFALGAFPVMRWGYNDLLMRKQDLCVFYNTNCRNKGVIIDIVSQITKMPFAEFSH